MSVRRGVTERTCLGASIKAFSMWGLNATQRSIVVPAGGFPSTPQFSGTALQEDFIVKHAATGVQRLLRKGSKGREHGDHSA